MRQGWFAGSNYWQRSLSIKTGGVGGWFRTI